MRAKDGAGNDKTLPKEKSGRSHRSQCGAPGESAWLESVLAAADAAARQASSSDQLYQTICDAAAGGGKFLMAAAIIHETGGAWMRVAAVAGAGAGAGADALRAERISVDLSESAGNSLVGEAYCNGKPCLANDITQDERVQTWRTWASDAGIGSAAAIPLLRGERPLGVLLYCSSNKDAFDEAVVSRLAESARNAVVAIEKLEHEAHERDRAERRLARLGRLYDALNSTIETILRARTPEELYSSVCEASVHGAKFQAATVFLREPDGTGIKGVASTGPYAKVAIGLKLSVDENVPEGRGWVGEAYRTQKPCFCNDLLTDPRVITLWRNLALKTGSRSVAALPLMQSGHCIGALVYHSGEFDEFDDEMIKLLQRIGANMSFALDNFEREAERDRAEAATRRASQMYAALSATNEAIMRARSPDELYQQVCDAAVNGGKYVIAGVLLPEPEGPWLRVAAASGTTRTAIELLRKARVSVDEARPEGRGPVGIAFRGKTPWICNDYFNDESTRPWQSLAREAGAASNAAIPLIRRGYAAGILLFHSSEKDAFDEGIVKLLERLAANVAFALDNFDHETERKHSQERIQYLATHDGLTDLPNRVMFAELLGAALQLARRYERKFAVLFIDLDRFKVINDTLGHEAGDKLLQEISARFKQSLRASDIVARLGGDEFVVLVQEVETIEQVAIIARKLLSSAIKPITLFGQECRVTASIGIAMYPGNGDDEQTLMKNADIAMYLAKEEGKNNFQFFSSDIKSQSLERLTLENNLRRALERDEFSLHYQAKLDTKSGEITGVEALLRWNNPELGMVSPMQFIPVAEETGLIIAIGKWVLTTACAQHVAWQRAGLPAVCIAVNLSPRQFADEDLLKDLDSALSDSGMDPTLLELEITESMVMGNVDRAARQLTAIKERGVRLAIDDFGTGYSSLAQIKRFPIDTIKVDRSFIRDIPQDSEDRAITQAIIAMGKTLSLTVIAEGVETQAQLDFLTENSCDEMQGFLFSKPIPPEEFAEFLREHNGKLQKLA